MSGISEKRKIIFRWSLGLAGLAFRKSCSIQAKDFDRQRWKKKEFQKRRAFQGPEKIPVKTMK